MKSLILFFQALEILLEIFIAWPHEYVLIMRHLPCCFASFLVFLGKNTRWGKIAEIIAMGMWFSLTSRERVLIGEISLKVISRLESFDGCLASIWCLKPAAQKTRPNHPKINQKTINIHIFGINWDREKWDGITIHPFTVFVKLTRFKV